MRAFWAIPLCSTLQDALDIWHAAAWPGDRHFVPAAQRHLTLHFFKDLSEAQMQEMLRFLAQSVLPGAYTVEVAGLGVFPHLCRPVVLWAGVKDRSGLLISLHSLLAEAASAAGLEVDSRPFKPHITLARLKTPLSTAEQAVLEQDTHTVFAESMQVSGCILYRSTLRPEGPLYTRLAELSFN